MARRPVNTRGLRIGPTGTILLVEDDDTLRQLLSQALLPSGYSVLEAANAATAKRIAQEKKNGIDLRVADIRMPGTSGRELADQLLLRPDMKTLFISGHDDGRAGGEADAPLLSKPLGLEDFVTRVKQILKP